MTLEYCERFSDVAFRKCFWFELEFRAFGLRDLESILRKMFWFGVEFSTCWTGWIRRSVKAEKFLKSVLIILGAFKNVRVNPGTFCKYWDSFGKNPLRSPYYM